MKAIEAIKFYVSVYILYMFLLNGENIVLKVCGKEILKCHQNNMTKIFRVANNNTI